MVIICDHRGHNILKMEDIGGSCSRQEVSTDKKKLGNNEENSSNEDFYPGFKTFEEFRQVV